MLKKKLVLFSCIIFSLFVHVSALSMLNFHLQLFFPPLSILMQLKNQVKEIAIDETTRHIKKEQIVPIILVDEKEKENVLEVKPSMIVDAVNPQYIYLPKSYLSLSYKPKDPASVVSIDFQSKYLEEKEIDLKISAVEKHKITLKKNNISKVISDLIEYSKKVNITKNDSSFDKTIKPVNQKEKNVIDRFEKSNLSISKTEMKTEHKLDIYDEYLVADPVRFYKELFPLSLKEKLILPPLLQRFPSLKDLSTISCERDFDLELSYAKRDDQKGYIFAITLIPNPKRTFKKIKQNFHFIMDRSNSIQKTRLTATRHAIASALLQLSDEDKFNIVAFDKTVEFLSKHNCEKSSAAFSLARKFLLKQNLGSFFSTTDVARPFYWIFSFPQKEDELNSIVFITNGKEFNHHNYHMIESISNANSGIFSINTIAMTDDENLGILDFLSFRNKGKLYSSSTLKGIKRQAQKLMHNINYPIAKNMSSHVINYNILNKVELFFSKNIPNLYLNQPYVIMGTAKTLDDFIIFFQGRHADQWFNIKKDISFSNAKESEILKEQLATQMAYFHYDKFLKENNVHELEKAKKILKSYNIKAAF